MTLRDHITSELARPSELYVVDGPSAPFRILQIEGVPQNDALVYVTEGVGTRLLEQPSGRLVRQELVLIVHQACASDDARRPIGTLADSVLGSGRALVRGEVVNGTGPMVDGSSLSAFCCLAPAPLPQSFWLFSDSDPPTMFIWLVPLTRLEAEFARRVGPDDFEGQLVEAQNMVDLFDLRRPEFLTPLGISE